MKELWLDFETYCDLNIKLVSGYNYANHSSFEVLCMGWAVDDKPANLWLPGMDFPNAIIHGHNQGVPIYAHNAIFEFRTFKRFEGGLFPLLRRVRPRNFVDTMALAGMFGLPLDLEGFCQASGAKVSKDKRGKHLVNKLCKPRKPSMHNPATRWTPETAPDDFRDLYEYCRTDVEAMRSAVRQLPLERLPKFEQLVWRHTIGRSNRGVYIDMESVHNIIMVMNDFKIYCNDQLAEITGGEITAGTQRDRIQNWLNREGCDIPNLQADTIRNRLSVTGDSPECRKVMELRLSLAKSSVAKFEKMVQLICEDGRVRDNEVYHAAHTGRFAGRGVQVHNLPRDAHDDPEYALEIFAHRDLDLVMQVYPDVNSAASKLVRSVITSAPGFDLLVADFTSIENVFLHWIAGDLQTTREFAQGLDQYKTFAADRFKVNYDEVTKSQRQFAKPNVLGLGYAGGAGALVRVANGYGIELTTREAKREVAFYRRKYPKVKKFWYALYGTVLKAIKNGRAVLRTRWARIECFRKGRWLFIRLPSGRILSYPQVRIRDGRYGEVFTYYGVKGRNFIRVWTHAGTITENVVQALARDALVYGALCAEYGGYPVTMTVHDEAVSEVKSGEGSVAEFCALLCTKQDWATTVPIKADGFRAKRYRKD